MRWTWLPWVKAPNGQTPQNFGSGAATGAPTVQLNNMNPSGQSLSHLTANHYQYPFPGVSDTGAPWNIYGYPAFSTWLAASEDNVILRRFDIVHGRVLLHMQDQIVQKEDELRKLDMLCVGGPNATVHNGSFRTDRDRNLNLTIEDARKRIRVLDELKGLLKEYDDFILKYRQLRTDPDPPEANVNNIKRWFQNHDDKENHDPDTGAITDIESDFIHHDGDLVSVVPKSQVPLRSFLEKYDRFMFLWLWKDKPRGNQYSDPNITISYQSEGSIRGAITVMTLAAGLAFLLIPPWGLWLLDTVAADWKALLMITCVVFGFTALLGIITVSRPFETIGAAAAYAAVLMVFLQIGNGSSGANTFPLNTTIVNSSVINSVFGNSSIANSSLANVTRLLS